MKRLLHRASICLLATTIIALAPVRAVPAGGNEELAAYSLGMTHYNAGNYQEAVDWLLKAAAQFEAIGNPEAVANARLNAANSYSRLGHYADALTLYSETLRLRHEEASAHFGMGLAYLRLGAAQLALQHFEESMRLDLARDNVAGALKNLIQFGNVLLAEGDPHLAYQKFEQALELSRQIKYREVEAEALGSTGKTLVALGNYSEALRRSEQALRMSRELSLADIETAAMGNSGEALLRLGRQAEALQYFEQARKLAEDRGDLELLWQINRSVAKIFITQNKIVEAVNKYFKSIDIIEDMHSLSFSLEITLRETARQHKRLVYEELIELLVQLHGENPNGKWDYCAFEVSERAKSQTFLEMLNRAQAGAVFKADASLRSLLERRQELKDAIRQLQERRDVTNCNSASDSFIELGEPSHPSVVEIQQQLRTLRPRIAKEHPEYASVSVIRPEPASVRDIQILLQPHERVVAYASTPRKTIAFIIRPTTFELIDLNLQSNILAYWVEKLRADLNQPDDYSDLQLFDPGFAYALYAKLFQPLEASLQGATTIYLSADGLLYAIPFEILVSKTFNRTEFIARRELGEAGEAPYLGEYSMLNYLVDNYTFVYMPSVSVYHVLRNSVKPGFGRWPRALIAFADPIFGPDDPAWADATHAEPKQSSLSRTEVVGIRGEPALPAALGISNLERLEESADEALAISVVVGGSTDDIYARERATEENVTQAPLAEARYILFSTHGLLDGDLLGLDEPALALTMMGNPPGRDGFLTMTEVLRLDLSAEMVVLSACKTAGRQVTAKGGEGFAGLTRSFVVAGAKSVIATHWNVDTEAARDLLISVFKAMRGSPRQEALRWAKHCMKASTRSIPGSPGSVLSLSHPYFWGAFVLVGIGEQVEESSSAGAVACGFAATTEWPPQ